MEQPVKGTDQEHGPVKPAKLEAVDPDAVGVHCGFRSLYLTPAQQPEPAETQSASAHINAPELGKELAPRQARAANGARVRRGGGMCVGGGEGKHKLVCICSYLMTFLC